MKLRLHHIEMCVRDLSRTVQILQDKFSFQVVGFRSTPKCEQVIVQSARTIFVVSCRAEFCQGRGGYNNNNDDGEGGKLSADEGGGGKEPEPWTAFCCSSATNSNYNRARTPPAKRRQGRGRGHTDSVFNIAIQVEDLGACLRRLGGLNRKLELVHDSTTVSNEAGSVTYAIVRSCCGNVLHTLIQKNGYKGWFLPGFVAVAPAARRGQSERAAAALPTHFDHVALACRVGETDRIIRWYEDAFGMRRFLTNTQDTDEHGLIIEGEVGMRLKVMEFWKCAETGVEPEPGTDTDSESLKIVVVESLPHIKNTQVENFLEDHVGPGIQHIGLHTHNIVDTVGQLIRQGVQFRHPPPAYYTEVGQLEAINSVGEDVELLREHGILLDCEADAVENTPSSSPSPHDRYLMQIFTFPIFDGDTFFLEIIQRKGARGFGVGNVTALARSVNASMLKNCQADGECPIKREAR